MNQFSDSESLDSEDGIRFKTDSTRNKTENRKPVERHSHSSTSDSYRHRRHRSPSPRRSHKSKKYKRRSRSNERDRRKKSKSRDRSPHDKRYQRYSERRSDRDRGTKSEVLSHRVVHDSSSSDESSFGPQLPQKQENVLNETKKNDSCRDKSSKLEDIPGQTLPQHSTKVDICGPTLPPHLLKDKSTNDFGPTISSSDNSLEEDSTNCKINKPKGIEFEENSGDKIPSNSQKEIQNSSEELVGPKLPLHLQNPKNEFVGPQLPPHLQKNDLQDSSSSEASNSSNSINDVGPSLPPSKESNVDERNCIGPTLPPHLRKQLEESSAEMDVGENEEGDDCYGPLPPELMATSQAHRALEERALQMKLDKLNDTGEVKTTREEWMIELPTVQAANLGLGPRQFRAKAGPDLTDRSSWTNTPKEKEKGPKENEVDLRKEAEMMEMYKHDQEQEKMIKKHKKKKKEKSLLEQHQDKLKKNKKKEEDEGGNVRRPFNRDIDLKVNQFDDAQKKSIMKKAQLLDDRFSKGQSKFL